MKPHTAERVERKQSQQHDATAKPRKFHIGDPVYLKDHTGSRRWLAGMIVKETGPVSFHVQLQDGQQKHCHKDQLRVRVVESDITVTFDNSGDGVPESTPEAATTSDSNADSATPPAANVSSEAAPPDTSVDQQSTNRYPRRNRKPRERFEPGTK